MKFLAVLVLFLTSCTAREVGNTLLPDEFTLGRGSSTINTTGGYQGHSNMYEYDGEGESSYGALTWHLPSLDEPMSREDRQRLRSESLLIDEVIVEETIEPETMAEGGTFTAEWRHAAVFGSIISLLLLILLIKLQRSNGWH